MLIELASLQTAFLTLDNAIKTTNRRVNALENVVCPKLDNTVAYIKVRPPPCPSRPVPFPRQAAQTPLLLCSPTALLRFRAPSISPFRGALAFPSHVSSTPTCHPRASPLPVCPSRSPSLERAGRARARGVFPLEEGAGEEEARSRRCERRQGTPCASLPPLCFLPPLARCLLSAVRVRRGGHP